MASHGGLSLAQEAIGVRHKCANTNPRGSKVMITVGLCVAATGILFLSLESVGAALVLFGLAGLLLAHG
jgi:uncharacterized membrane protein YhhN